MNCTEKLQLLNSLNDSVQEELASLTFDQLGKLEALANWLIREYSLGAVAADILMAAIAKEMLRREYPEAHDGCGSNK